MQHQEFEPPEELRDAVRCFWYSRRDSDGSESTFEVLPDGYAEVIFYFGNGLNISKDESWQSLPSPFLVGLLNRPVVFRSKGCLEIIGVRCFPWTVFDLLGLPSGNDGVRIFDHPVVLLQPVLSQWMQSGRIEEAIAEVKEYFQRARLRIETSSMLFKAGVAMRKANGAIPVSQVAAAAHATARTLERRFKQSSGFTVKDVSSVMRFEQARNQLWLDPCRNLADLAQELGYADQSHLSREFKRYGGITPGAFSRKAKERQQIAGDDFVAFIQS